MKLDSLDRSFIIFQGLYNGECRPFVVDGLQVGVIRPDILKELFRYPEVFVIKDKEKSKVVELNPAFRDYNERTDNVDRVLRKFRHDNTFIALKGWRDEVYANAKDNMPVFFIILFVDIHMF